MRSAQMRSREITNSLGARTNLDLSKSELSTNRYTAGTCHLNSLLVIL